MEPCPFLWLVLDASIFFLYISSNYNVFFRDVVIGYWGRFVIALYDLRPFPFLIAALATQASAAVAHSYLPYFQEFFSFGITHTL